MLISKLCDVDVDVGLSSFDADVDADADLLAVCLAGWFVRQLVFTKGK